MKDKWVNICALYNVLEMKLLTKAEKVDDDDVDKGLATRFKFS